MTIRIFFVLIGFATAFNSCVSSKTELVEKNKLNKPAWVNERMGENPGIHQFDDQMVYVFLECDGLTDCLWRAERSAEYTIANRLFPDERFESMGLFEPGVDTENECLIRRKIRSNRKDMYFEGRRRALSSSSKTEYYIYILYKKIG
ncbi:MAG: hypothetical protein HRU19_21595 [Pseudobacteriovorax sp.]|nr:hypothetical protein [Pseudobacteriovorax sp.]